MSISLSDEGVLVSSRIISLNFVGDRQRAFLNPGADVGNIQVSAAEDLDNFNTAGASFTADQVPLPDDDLLITNVTLNSISNLTWDSVNRELKADETGFYAIFASGKSDFVASRLCEPSFRTVVYPMGFIFTTSFRTRFFSTKTWCGEADWPSPESYTNYGRIFGADSVLANGVILEFPEQEEPSPPAEDFLAGDTFVEVNVVRLREFYR